MVKTKSKNPNAVRKAKLDVRVSHEDRVIMERLHAREKKICARESPESARPREFSAWVRWKLLRPVLDTHAKISKTGRVSSSSRKGKS